MGVKLVISRIGEIMKEAFKFRERARAKKITERLNWILKILDEDEDEIFTVRQMYYQLVGRNLISNDRNSYQNICNLIRDCRLYGELDWDRIEDRTIDYMCSRKDKNIADYLDGLEDGYHPDFRKGQRTYIEVWFEKQAIYNRISSVCNRHDISFQCHGRQCSVTALYNASERFFDKIDSIQQAGIVLYIGDFDPFGYTMDIAIQNRLEQFDTDVDFERIGITKEQAIKYKIPPNRILDDDDKKGCRFDFTHFIHVRQLF